MVLGADGKPETRTQKLENGRRGKASQASGAGDGFQRLHVASNLGGNLVLGNFQVVACLEIHPEGRGVRRPLASSVA